MGILSVITIFTGISFLYFGITCLTTEFMKNEFARYGLAKQRVLTGILQIIGATGILMGMKWSPLLVLIAAGGLFVLMVAGYIVRLRIKDSFLLSLPALFYAVLSLYVCYSYYVRFQV